MCPSQAFLWSCLVFLTTTESSAFLLNDPVNTSVSHPDNSNYNIYSKIDALERTLHNLETTVREKTAQMDTLETSVREKTTHSDTLMRQVLLTVTEMDTKIESSDLINMTLEVEKIKSFVKNSLENPVGFTAKLNGTYSDSYSIITGHRILYNQGNAYNGTVFTCPSPGLYLFQVSLITNSNDNGIWIYKNSEELTLAWSSSFSSFDASTTSAATWLDIGDHVYLKSTRSSLYIDPNSAIIGVKIN